MSDLHKGWKKTILESIVNIGSSKRIFLSDYVTSGIAFYRSKEVIEKQKGNYISLELFITKEKFNEIKEKYGVPIKDDLLLTSVGTLGIPYLVKENEIFYFKDGNLTWFSKYNNLEPRFLYYFFLSSIGKERLNEIKIGSTQSALTISGLKKITIDLPPINEQKAIAHILSSFDNKIELLKEQNRTLETMAQTIFKEWFIENKNTKLYLFEELVQSVSIKHKFNDKKVIFLNTSDIYDGKVLHHEYSNVEGLPGQAKKSIQKDDILFTEIRPANKRFAYINFEADDYVVSTKLMVLRSKNIIDTSILYLFLKLPYTLKYLQILAESRSGTFPQITFENIKSMKIFIPNDKLILQNYTSLFKSIITKTFQNHKSIQTLQKTRDTLLAKLISGEKRVKGFENG